MNVHSLEFQKTLACYYRMYMADPAELARTGANVRAQRAMAEVLEDLWIKEEVAAIDLDALPERKSDFLDWYQARERSINVDISEFIDFLQDEATLEQIAYYICMEEMVDGSFDDLMALVQVGMPLRQKMTAGANYWDELGNGDLGLVHTAMFRTSSGYLRQCLKSRSIAICEPTAACLMNGNILLMMATRRDYNLRLVGAIGLVEGSAPKRFSATTKAMQRLKLPPEVVEYHKAHISIDTRHSKDWFDNVLIEYARRGKRVIRELSLGVELRYRIALGYYESMLRDMNHLFDAKVVA